MNMTVCKYIGEVNVKLKINDKIVNLSTHNSGTPNLQRAFCKFVCGNTITVEDIPQFLDLRKSSDEFENEQSCLLNRVALTGKSWDELRYSNSVTESTSEYIAKFTGVISSNSLSALINKGDTRKYRLYLCSGSLYSNTGFYDLAYIDVSAEDLSHITVGTQAVIEWSMKIDV